MENWVIPGYLERENGHLHMDGVDVVQLAETYGTPVYIFSEKRLKENVREILDGFREFHPNTSLHYAAKCESTLANLEIIREAGSDIEVNSGGELFKALLAGFRGDQIVFNGVAKSVAEIENAVLNEIKSINIDSRFELLRVREVAKRLGKKANIVFRFVPEVSTGVVKGNDTGTHESKFGITHDKIIDVFKEAYEWESELNVRGIHFHIGTQTFDLKCFVDAFKVMLETALRIYQATGRKMEILNIGGGLPVPYLKEIAPSQYMPENIYLMLRGRLTVKEIAAAIAEELKSEKVAKWAGDENKDLFADCELIVEAGRKVVADAGILLSKIENEKVRGIDEPWLMLDAGFNTLLEVKTYYWYYPMVLANKADEPCSRDFKVAGPCCDSGDVYFDIDYHKNLPDYRKLPASATVGDLVAMLAVGAYGTPTMFNYNGRPRAGILLIHEDGRVSISKRPENYRDLVRGELSVKDLRKGLFPNGSIGGI